MVLDCITTEARTGGKAVKLAKAILSDDRPAPIRDRRMCAVEVTRADADWNESESATSRPTLRLQIRTGTKSRCLTRGARAQSFWSSTEVTGDLSVLGS